MYTHPKMILYMQVSNLLFLLLYFFNGLPGIGDFLKFTSALLTVVE